MSLNPAVAIFLAVILFGIILSGAAVARFKARQSNNTVALLSQYVDLVNTHGPDSREATEFLERHKNNKRLAFLMRRALAVREQLKREELP